ncbi:MAG: hypothetical protein Pars2KO_25420 [Parasphingorhabdus sp.]
MTNISGNIEKGVKQGLIIPCPKCGQSISMTSKQCPHCNAKFSKDEVRKSIADNSPNVWGCSAILVALVGGVVGIGYWAFVPTAEDKAAKAAELALQKEKGFHCLSQWDGSHDGVKTRTIAVLRDPDSFEHIETRITSRKTHGQHGIIMKYRARNGFGGMDAGEALANISSIDCSIVTFNLSSR